MCACWVSQAVPVVEEETEEKKEAEFWNPKGSVWDRNGRWYNADGDDPWASDSSDDEDLNAARRNTYSDSHRRPIGDYVKNKGTVGTFSRYVLRESLVSLASQLTRTCWGDAVACCSYATFMRSKVSKVRGIKKLLSKKKSADMVAAALAARKRVTALSARQQGKLKALYEADTIESRAFRLDWKRVMAKTAMQVLIVPSSAVQRLTAAHVLLLTPLLSRPRTTEHAAAPD